MVNSQLIFIRLVPYFFIIIPFDLSDETVPVLIFSSTGEQKSIKDIAPNNVISCYKSYSLTKLVVCDNIVNNDMTSLSVKNGNTADKCC